MKPVSFANSRPIIGDASILRQIENRILGINAVRLWLESKARSAAYCLTALQNMLVYPLEKGGKDLINEYPHQPSGDGQIGDDQPLYL